MKTPDFKPLELKSIAKSFDGITLFEDINLSLHAGERASLFGASGSGKSTLLQIGAGLVKQDKGDVLIMGKNLNTEDEILRARREYFGFIFQFHNLIPELNVVENISIAQAISGKKDKNFIDFLLNELSLFEKRNQKPQTLSGGEAQRVAVIRAFATKPKIVFADEPTGSLDPETANKTIDLILKLAKDLSVSLLTVTHNTDFKTKFDTIFEIKNKNIAFSNCSINLAKGIF